LRPTARSTISSKSAKRETPPSDLRASHVQLGSGSYVLVSFARGAPSAASRQLTPSERSVASWLVEGLSNAEIARLRGSRPRTVAKQVASIYRKLGVGSRAELAACCGRALSRIES
jgi:DNA-binding NarL/FixJ family response regulator